MCGTLMHYWPVTDPEINDDVPPILVDTTGNSTTSEGDGWCAGPSSGNNHIEQSNPGAGYSAESSCLKVGRDVSGFLNDDVLKLIPNAYNPGSGSDDKNSCGMWIRQVNPRVENDFNSYLIAVKGSSVPNNQSLWRINRSTNEVKVQHGGGEASPFAYTQGSGWALVGFTESYDTGANETTFKFYSNGSLINTDVISGDVGGLHFLSTPRRFYMQFESNNTDISQSFHMQGAAFIVRGCALIESQWLQLYNAGS
jgi:hypothetical protein